MPTPAFSPGFRLSALDALILAGGVAAAIFAPNPFAIIAATAIGHFFLFCNVFRMSRRPELIWAATFTLLSAATLFFGLPGWPATAALSFALAAILIARETRQPYYHGIAWRRLNPRLPEWWQSRQDG